LETQGRFAQAEKILIKIESEFPNLPSIAPGPVPGFGKQLPFTILFHREVITRTLLSVFFAITLGFSVYGLIGWLPSFFVKQGLTIVSSLQFTTAMSLGAPFGALLTFLLADRTGRRETMITASLVSAVLALAYPRIANPTLLTLCGFCLVTSIYVWFTTGTTIVAEIFATAYRFRGVGFGSAIGRLVTAMIQCAIVPLFTWGGVQAIVGSLAVMLVLQALSFWLFAVETVNKPLEAVEPDLAVAGEVEREKISARNVGSQSSALSE
jgi:MFS transporter, putative metabolite:H+ symporter